jgi:glycosyltransferase domain-containing protein
MENSVTVVIPTHERHRLLENRVLPYYLQFNVPILIIDSSQQPHQPSVENPAIQYIHCPGEPIPHKLKRPILDHVHTQYMFMNADDTLHSMQGVRTCIEYLEANPDYSTALGMLFQCHHDDRSRVDSNSFDLYSLPVDSDRAEERLLQDFTRFDTLFYAVSRTDCWQNTMRRMPGEIVNYYLMETYIVMMALIHGKRAKLPIMYSATEAGPSINDQDPRYHCSPFKLATENRYAGEVAAVKKAALTYLQDKSGISEARARLYVNGALALYWLQDKPIKSPGDRIRNEWKTFLSKTFCKKKYKRLKAEKRALNLKERAENTKKSFEILGEDGRREYEQLMKRVQET